MKKTNKAIENCTKKLLEEQSIQELRENLAIIYENWYNPNLCKHKKIMFDYQELKELLYLLNFPEKFEIINKQIISKFSIHPTQGINSILFGFKDMFINYIDPRDGTYPADIYLKMFRSYNLISNYLTELIAIENDYNIHKRQLIKSKN